MRDRRVHLKNGSQQQDITSYYGKSSTGAVQSTHKLLPGPTRKHPAKPDHDAVEEDVLRKLETTTTMMPAPDPESPRTRVPPPSRRDYVPNAPRPRQGGLLSHSPTVLKDPKIDAFLARWAGGRQQYEDLLRKWSKEDGLFNQHGLSYWGKGVVGVMRLFTQIRRDKSDKTQKGPDSRFIPLVPDDVFWWLQHDLDLENDEYVSEHRSGHVLNRRKAKQFERFADLVLPDRSQAACVTTYEHQVEVSFPQLRAWSGQVVVDLVEKAKSYRDQEVESHYQKYNIDEITPQPLTQHHFELARRDILADQGTQCEAISGALRRLSVTKVPATTGVQQSTRPGSSAKRSRDASDDAREAVMEGRSAKKAKHTGAVA